MVDVLSQDEINALISSYKSSGIQEESNKQNAGRQIRLYDFTRPDKFSKDHLRSLNGIHAKHGTLFAAGLGGMLRMGTQVDLLALDQLTYREYCASVSEGTLFVEVSLEPLASSAVFEFSPQFVSLCVELLAGSPGISAQTSIEITEVDCAIIRTIVDVALRKYTDAWSASIALNPKILNMMVGTTTTQIFLPAEAVLVCGYEVTIGESLSMISICVPAASVESILPSLTMGRLIGSSAKGLESANEHLMKNFDSVNLQCKAYLGRTTLSLQDILDIEVGDIIKLNNKATGPVELYVENREIFCGRLGTSGRNLALRIDGPVTYKD